MGDSWRRQHGLRSHGTTWVAVIALAGLAWAVAMMLGGTRADANESYHNPNGNDVEYCTGCHDGFTEGRKGSLHRLHTSGDSALGVITRNCALCHTGSGRDNPMTMWSKGDAGDGLGCAGCHGRDYGETIGEDYRGFPIMGLPKATAYGLRAHHATKEITTCELCHNEAPLGVLAENVAPPYYSRADVNVSDPCADLLDNDGDGLPDSLDPDCAAASPLAVDDGYSTPQDTTLSVAAPGVLTNDSDPNGDPLTAVLDGEVSNGTLTLDATGSFTYMPGSGFTGTDSFTYTAHDGTAASNVATVTIIVGAPNDPPVADAGGPYGGAVGGAVDFDGSGSFDTDGSIVAYDWDFGDGDSGSGVTPSHEYAAIDTYTVVLTVTDDDGLTDTATTTASITAGPNSPPVAADDGYATSQNVSLSVAAPGLLTNDWDANGDPLTAVLDADVSTGTLTLDASGSFTYVPVAGFVGSDSFTYVASDGIEHSDVATVTITVNLGGIILAVDDSYSAFADSVLTVAAPGISGNDVGGSPRYTYPTSAPTNGSVAMDTDGSFIYTPAAGFVGSDSFAYEFWDGQYGGWSNVATITIEVHSVDLDIDRFRATNRISQNRFKGITLTLTVLNNGSVDVPDAEFGATATIVGRQGAAEVHRETFPIWDSSADTATEFEITIGDAGPFALGEVVWTATLDVPGDSDIDVATASTVIAR